MAEKQDKLSSPELIRRLAKISGREYGLLRILAKHSLVDMSPVQKLLTGVVTDRMSLAQQYLAFAQDIPLESEFHGRQVISRGYYAMHHAARAVIFASKRQDITSHEGVIKEIVRILGQELARILVGQLDLRNEVEYEVYPRSDIVELAQESLLIVTKFIENCIAYLERR